METEKKKKRKIKEEVKIEKVNRKKKKKNPKKSKLKKFPHKLKPIHTSEKTPDLAGMRRREHSYVLRINCSDLIILPVGV